MTAPAAQLSEALDVVRASATCAYGRLGGVLLVNWRRQVLLDDVRGVVAYRNLMIKQQFYGAIHMSEPGLPLPDEECRRLARRGMETRTDQKAAIALVIFGDGFGASAVRSVGTAIFAMRSGPPTRIFSQAPEAASWLAEELDGAVEAPRLAEACLQLRKVTS